ncbi:MAG: cytochrome c [Nitrospinae bacterium]|nr:cytochrome c [Nitrospinota bacterium]
MPSAVLIFASALFLAAAAPLSAPDLEKGWKIYVAACQVCHGEKGDGQTFVANVLNPPPRNFTSPASKKELTLERMLRSVTRGRPGTAMMPWKENLTAGEIRAAVAFIRREFMELRE